MALPFTDVSLGDATNARSVSSNPCHAPQLDGGFHAPSVALTQVAVQYRATDASLAAHRSIAVVRTSDAGEMPLSSFLNVSHNSGSASTQLLASAEA